MRPQRGQFYSKKRFKCNILVVIFTGDVFHPALLASLFKITSDYYRRYVVTTNILHLNLFLL